MARECQKELETTVGRKWDVEVMPGKANLEVRPTFINKGEIAKRLVLEHAAPATASTATAAVQEHGQLSPPPEPEAATAVGMAGSAAADSKAYGTEFVLCLGDDFTDEDMFRSLNGLSSYDDDAADPNKKHKLSGVGGASGSGGRKKSAPLLAEHVFTVTVGASTKLTLARWHLLEPEDVIECVALLAGVGGDGGGATGGGVLSMGEVNLAALSTLEGRLPVKTE
jgi:trehalose 6-phosphate synthase/phosphatase